MACCKKAAWLITVVGRNTLATAERGYIPLREAEVVRLRWAMSYTSPTVATALRMGWLQFGRPGSVQLGASKRRRAWPHPSVGHHGATTNCKAAVRECGACRRPAGAFSSGAPGADAKSTCRGLNRPSAAARGVHCAAIFRRTMFLRNHCRAALAINETRTNHPKASNFLFRAMEASFGSARRAVRQERKVTVLWCFT